MTETLDSPQAPPPQDRTTLVGHVELECEAVLGRGRMTVSTLNTLVTGAVVSLDCTPADPVDIRVNGKTVARGEIVTADGKFAVRISEFA